MQYQIVYGSSERYFFDALKELQVEVEKLLQKGFKPQGGVSITLGRGYSYIACQAMVKED